MWPFNKKGGSGKGPGLVFDCTEQTKHKTCEVCGRVNHVADMANAEHDTYPYHWYYVCNSCIPGSHFDRRKPNNDRRKPTRKGKK